MQLYQPSHTLYTSYNNTSVLTFYTARVFKNTGAANTVKDQLYLTGYSGSKMSLGTQKGMSVFLNKYLKGWCIFY